MRAAILDLNNAVANKGIGYLKKLLENHEIPYEVFDVRNACQVPDTSFDIYLSSGGPGSPFDMDGVWDKKYFQLIQDLWNHNAQETPSQIPNLKSQIKKKYVFFICHSFQLACIHFNVGNIAPRGVKSFGTFPTFKTTAGEQESYFQNLPNPFWIADFRDWQVINPDENALAKQGFQICALERPRKNPQDPRALMAIRFSPEMFATQFHPEADADGMLYYFQEREKRNQLIQELGMDKYMGMIEDLEDPNKIELTHNTLLPTFLKDAIKNIQLANVSSIAD